MQYADIIIDISQGKLDKTFQYCIPQQLEEEVKLGSQVRISFGSATRKLTGYVVGISDKPKIDPARIKPIDGVVRDSIAIETQLIALAAWIKENCGSTMNQALKTVIPIKQKQSTLEKKDVILLLSQEEAQNELVALMSRARHSVAKERLLKELMDKKSIPWDAITGKLNVPSTNIRDFEKKGWVRIESHRAFRNPLADLETRTKKIPLNEMQLEAFDRFAADWDAGIHKTYLLYGVTGSGKTEVYMEMMEKVLNQGRQVILLIPEIALTYQTVMRFYGRFGDQVSIMNSRLTPAERADQMERARNGDIRIMVGPRSALFTPFQNLGLIIIDEEHEASYKSEQVPKYHARDVARERARLAGASVVLGSATPALETFNRAKAGIYTMLELPKRVDDRPLPHCEVVDLRQELREGNRSIISRRLHDLIQDRLDKKQQVILFINRRGLMGFVSCRACGHVIKCPHCDVSLSVHNDGRMHCHYCGFTQPIPKVCPKCGSKYIGGFKAGTQKFQAVVEKEFPQARVLRMDLDTTRGKNGHKDILSAFSNQEADILIGTQMIVKGHDFPNVTLVGALAADMSLNASDYRGSERTFQLLTQAAGRAGRGKIPGDVVIQTYQTEHFAIQTAAAQDYEGFYDQEIAYRSLMEYPPFSHMLQIEITSSREEDGDKQAQIIAGILGRFPEPVRIMGPQDAQIARVADVWRKVIYVRDSDYNKLVRCKNLVEEYILEAKGMKDVAVWFDFDPMSAF